MREDYGNLMMTRTREDCHTRRPRQRPRSRRRNEIFEVLKSSNDLVGVRV